MVDFNDTVLFERLKKRVLQIADEVSYEYSEDHPLIQISQDDPDEIIATKLKLIAVRFNCSIISWVNFYEGAAEVYEASVYDEDLDDTWELIPGKTEAQAVIIGFKWLADKGYFVKK